MATKLRRKLLFSDLGSSAQIEAILAKGRTVEYDVKHAICEEGDASDCIFVILRGRVEFFLKRDNRESHNIYLDEQGPGEYFGEHGVFSSGTRSASAQAKEKTVCRVIDGKNFEDWLVENPRVALALLGHASARIRDLSGDLRASTSSAYARVARYLTQAAVHESGQLVVRDMPPTKQLARRLGISRERTSQILNDLERGGFIETRGSVLVIKRPLPESY